jgi:gas vesicle protein
MSERSGGGFGAFLFGIVLGAAAGFLFAPEGGDTRKRMTKGLRSLKALAEEKVDEVRGLLEEAEEDEEPEEESDEEEPEVAVREQLRRRLQAARRRRKPVEEDEPLA